jgi:DNA-binding NtrC family response regulator
MVDLRVDIDDLRRDFDSYRRGAALDVSVHDLGSLPRREILNLGTRDELEDTEDVEAVLQVSEPEPLHHGGPSPDDADAGVVVFRPGMTMDDMERAVIQAALDSVGGNRRKAAELLGIGERTLYRKIGKYEVE